MCIESDKLREISFDNAIEEFIDSKSRKKIILMYSALGHIDLDFFIFQKKLWYLVLVLFLHYLYLRKTTLDNLAIYILSVFICIFILVISGSL